MTVSNERKITVLSLGAGVQSSTLALMAEKGLIEKPSFAVFADTQAEPASVYSWLDWLEGQLSFPIIRVSHGNLAIKALELKTSKAGNKYLSSDVPFYTLNVKGVLGTTRRQCTSRYKIEPIYKAVKSFKKFGVKMQIGISTDEAGRQKPSRKKWIENVFPLIELSMSRSDCLRWLDSENLPTPPRSACVFCPYHSDNEWNDLKRNDPASFYAAVKFESDMQKQIKNVSKITSEWYLHNSRKPLDKTNFRNQDQPSLFNNECEGMCGL